MTGTAEKAIEVNDEYTIQPDELTKEQFAAKAGVTIRAVEIWKKEGKLPAQKIRRRIDGVVRTTTIFKLKDVEGFLNKQNSAVTFPTVSKNELQKTNEDEKDFLTASQLFIAENLGKFADSMNNFADTMNARTLPPAEKDEKPFLNVKEAAEFTGLSESSIRQLVKDETLKKFTGKHGETMISRKQLLNL